MNAESDFDAQQRTEAAIRDAVAAVVRSPLHARPMALPSGVTVDVDGVNPAQTVFVELFARRGRLKGPQLDKVARDALKLVTLGRGFPGARLIIAFADAEAAASVTGGSWLAEALRTWSVEVLVVAVDADPADAGGA